MSERPKTSEVIAALEQGRKVTVDGRTYDDVYSVVLGSQLGTCSAKLVGIEVDGVSLNITIAPPTSYTLEEAAAALVRGEKVLCGMNGTTYQVTSIETRGPSLFVRLDGRIECDASEVSNIRPAPPEPSIEELIRAHDPVGNPTVEVSETDEEHLSVPISRFSPHARQAMFLVDVIGHVFSARFDRNGVCVDKNITARLSPISDDGRRALKKWDAEWAKGQQS